jgi:membrane carboxypeptidase/penicillin-binding protein
VSAAAIANDGVLMKPMLVKSIEAADGTVITRYSPTRASTEPAIKASTSDAPKRTASMAARVANARTRRRARGAEARDGRTQPELGSARGSRRAATALMHGDGRGADAL